MKKCDRKNVSRSFSTTTTASNVTSPMIHRSWRVASIWVNCLHEETNVEGNVHENVGFSGPFDHGFWNLELTFVTCVVLFTWTDFNRNWCLTRELLDMCKNLCFLHYSLPHYILRIDPLSPKGWKWSSAYQFMTKRYDSFLVILIL